MASLLKSKKGSSLLSAAMRKKTGIGLTGASGKGFQGSTQYTGLTAGLPEGAGHPPKKTKTMGPARTTLSR